jgi:tRNA dimethylallyltransferase
LVLQETRDRQIIQFLDGEIDLDTAIAKTKQVHRNYAKRQLTWLRKNKDIHWVVNTDNAEELIAKFLH